MKIRTPDGYEIELTPEEFKRVAPRLAAQLEQKTEGRVQSEERAEEKEIRKVIRAVLQRRPIPEGQKDLFRALLNAGDEGLPQEQLAREIGRSIRELNGVLGAFGRRIANTEGADTGIGLALEVTNRGDGWRYRMKDALREELQGGNYL